MLLRFVPRRREERPQRVRDGLGAVAPAGEIAGQASPGQRRGQAPQGGQPAAPRGHSRRTLIGSGEGLGGGRRDHVRRQPARQQHLPEPGRAGALSPRHAARHQAGVLPVVQIPQGPKTQKGTADRLGRMPFAFQCCLELRRPVGAAGQGR